jgi:hypothetical protein
MVHHERAGRLPAESVMFCFMASDQLEPIIVAVVVHPELGRLQYINYGHAVAAAGGCHRATQIPLQTRGRDLRVNGSQSQSRVHSKSQTDAQGAQYLISSTRFRMSWLVLLTSSPCRIFHSTTSALPWIPPNGPLCIANASSRDVFCRHIKTFWMNLPLIRSSSVCLCAVASPRWHPPCGCLGGRGIILPFWSLSGPSRVSWIGRCVCVSRNRLRVSPLG